MTTKSKAKKNKAWSIQQGDVFIERVASIPEGAVPHNEVLAEGEATGHAHRIRGKGVQVMEHQGVLYINVPEGSKGTITHEEHHQQVLPPGLYTSRITQEYDHFAEESRNVRD